MKSILLFMICALFLFAACNPEQPQNAPEPQEDQVIESTAQVQEESNDDQPVEETTEVEETVEEDKSVDMRAFFTKKGKIEYRVDYQMTSMFDGQADAMQLTQYVKDEQMRSDATVSGIETRTYINGDEITSCTNDGGWNCFVVPEYEASPSDQTQDMIEEDPEQHEAKSLPDRTIAGTKATCFAVTVMSDESEATAEYCFSDEGVPLYVKTYGDGWENELTATDYETSVASNAFDLPAEPSAFPGAGGNLPSGEIPAEYADLVAQYS